jgi:pyruvate formate lyase activating enzyme
VVSERARLESVRGVVFNIQRMSMHDGPGVRTNVFLKGCPLRCAWCANPESQQLQPELALSEHNCIACGQFDRPCTVCWPQRQDTTAGIALESLAPRVDVCPTGAIHWMGEWRSAGEVMAEVRRDRPFYGDGGGLTLTGGEPTMQPAMCEALLSLARDDGIATAMETCGHTQWQVFERLLPHLDLLLIDVKHVDATIHRQYTGIDNTLILENLRRILAAGKPVRVRVPLIPGFNATPGDLAAIATFVADLPGPLLGVDLLPYHTLGKSKYAALGREYLWQEHARLAQAEIDNLAEVVRAQGLLVTVGG